MIAEAPGPLDFQMLLQLFGEKMSGTTPRRPSWPAGTCSTPPPPARWASMPSSPSSATAVSRPTVSPRPRLPRCS